VTYVIVLQKKNLKVGLVGEGSGSDGLLGESSRQKQE